MLAGCSSLVSPRHNTFSDNSNSNSTTTTKMGTQRLNLPCNFPRRDSPRVAIADQQSSFPFRRTPTSISTSVTKKEADEGPSNWNKPTRKRFSEDIVCATTERNKKLKLGSDDDNWLPAYVSMLGGRKDDRSCFLASSKQEEETRMMVSREGEEAERLLLAGNESGRRAGSSRGVVTSEDENSRLKHQGLELVGLVTVCAESIMSGNYAATNYFLVRLGELASPNRTAVHRLIAYFTEGLALRVSRIWPHTFRIVDQDEDDDNEAFALQCFNQIGPIPKFIHFTLNEMLLRAFDGKERVHIIDFDIKQGLQWPGLMSSLAARPNPPTHVRITGIGNSKQELQDTGVRLAGFAEALGLPFQFHSVVDSFEDVRFWMLHVKEGECVAVNCVTKLHKALYDETGNVLMELLGLIRSTSPAIVLVGEREADHNNPSWEMRFANSLMYYSALFDSIEAGSPTSSTSFGRKTVEETFGREIRNIISCEGRDRVERHQTFAKWKRVMEERGGFRCVGITHREIMQSKMLLKMFDCDNFNVTAREDIDSSCSSLTLSWLDQPLYTVSAWAPTDVAGTSTSASQAQ